MKVCSKCREPQDLSDFHKRKGGKDGCTSQCKSCVNRYYEVNKERIKGLYEANKEANKEKRSEYSKKYSEERPGEMAERTRKWRLDMLRV